MASIRKRGTKWQVQVRRHGFPPVTRSFNSRADALEWGRHWEGKADRAELPESKRALNVVTLGELVNRYLDSVVPAKRGSQVEGTILRAFLREPICRKKLSALGATDFAEYRDRRLQESSPRSLARQLSPLRNMFKTWCSETGCDAGRRRRSSCKHARGGDRGEAWREECNWICLVGAPALWNT